MYLALWFCICLTATLSLSEAIPCGGSAKYNLTFQAEWTQISHPEDFPSGHDPHFSALVGCTHDTSYVMWKPGILASQGVKDVAEMGRTTDINKEIDGQIKSGNALEKFQGPSTNNTGTSVVNDIDVSTKYPRVSVMAKIAPSPDWFVGVYDLNLCNETTGKWVDKWVGNSPLYDAGTDSANTFVHMDNPTIPQHIIIVTNSSHNGSIERNNTTIGGYGNFTFEKTSEDLLSNNRTKPITSKNETEPTTTSKNETKPTTTSKNETKPTTISKNETKPITTSNNEMESTTNDGLPITYLNFSMFLKLIIPNLLLTFYIT